MGRWIKEHTFYILTLYFTFYYKKQLQSQWKIETI